MNDVIDKEEMGRVSVTLPEETLRQITEWAAAVGLKRGQFNSVALVIGARTLARQLSPELFMNADAWEGISKAMSALPDQPKDLVKKALSRQD